jgi:molybdenum cofactor cytidylyltransferase/nicotine blue oxidoreductase
MTTRQAVLILAAGHGRRMGEPKVFSVFRGQTFLQRILSRSRESGSPVTLVLDPRFRAPVEAELRRESAQPLTIVEADGHEAMIASVKAGLRSGNCDQGFWLWPVDAPFISRAGWARAVAEVAREPEFVRKLRVQEHTGHPIWYPAWSVPEILAGVWHNGLRGFLADHHDRVRVLAMEREFLKDVNTREQLALVPDHVE